MLEFCFLLKSYAKDLNYAVRLIKSIEKFNIDKICLYVVVPQKDLSLFIPYKSNLIVIVDEEVFCDELFNHSIPNAGYLNQQIIKLVFWELGITKNYFCIDSECVFIKNFYLDDFMFDENTPYSILVEDNELRVEPEYYYGYWEKRIEYIDYIKKEIGLPGKAIITCHGMTTFSAEVLKSFKENYLSIKGLTYKDIISKAPYEFSWYNFWLQKFCFEKIRHREPLFKTFHNEGQLVSYKYQSIRTSDIARGYLGYIINSNFSRDFELLYFDNLETKYLRKGQLIPLLKLLWSTICDIIFVLKKRLT
jgi:hypothetical protein